MRRTLSASLLCFTALVAAAAADAPAALDTIHRIGTNPIQCLIESETSEDVRYLQRVGDKLEAGRPVRWSTIERIDYAGMDSGAWAKGVEARQRGDYEVAADLFNQLASGGKREWERVKGSFAEGECLEMAGKLDQAAQAFDRIVQQFGGDPAAKPPVPRHRIWLDAQYRKGMCLALAGKNGDAERVVASLFELGKKEASSAADVRGNGIRTVIAVLGDNPMKFREFNGKAVFSAERETEAWFHFKYIVAEKLRTTAKKPKEALAVYREIQAVLPALPVSRDREVQVALGLGLGYADNGQIGQAITELLRIDTLPHGSPEQRCEAGATVARLMWEESRKITGDAEAMKSPRNADWAKELEANARFVAKGAASGPAGCPGSGAAKSLLQTMGQ